MPTGVAPHTPTDHMWLPDAYTKSYLEHLLQLTTNSQVTSVHCQHSEVKAWLP